LGYFPKIHIYTFINAKVLQFPLYYFLVYQSYELKVFESRLLRRIFALKRDEVTGVWRKLHNEELHNLYSSPNIIRIITSRRMTLAEHVERMGRKRNT
jgi:hypothetical protein